MSVIVGAAPPTVLSIRACPQRVAFVVSIACSENEAGQVPFCVSETTSLTAAVALYVHAR